VRYRCDSCNSIVDDKDIVRHCDGFLCSKCIKISIELDRMIIEGKIKQLMEKRE